MGLLLTLTSSSASFSPTDLSNLALWLDAGDSSTITESGGAVSQWDDKSGNARNISQGTGANQPTYTSGSHVSFNGTTDYLYTSSPFMHAAGAITAFLVYDNVTNAGGAILSESNYTNNTPLYVPVTVNTTGTSMRFLNRDDLATMSGGINVKDLGGTFFDGVATGVAAFKDTGTELNAYDDGVITSLSPLDYTRGSTTTLNRMTVGATIRTSVIDYVQGDIKEIVIYEGSLTNAEMNQVGNYLASKWGLAWADLSTTQNIITGADNVIVGVDNLIL